MHGTAGTIVSMLGGFILSKAPLLVPKNILGASF
jgi:hypothetical protein